MRSDNPAPSPNPPGYALCAVAMTAVSAVVAGAAAKSYAVPVFAVALAAAGFAAPPENRAALARRWWPVLFLTPVVFLIKWLAMPLDPGVRTSTFTVDYALLNALAECLLVLQAAVLHLPPPALALPGRNAPTPSLPMGLGALAMGCALGFAANTMREHILALGASALFAGLAGTLFVLCRGGDLRPAPGRLMPLLYALILVVVLAGGSAGAVVINRVSGRLDEIFGLAASSLGMQQTGFSGQGSLDSVRRSRSFGWGVALRVEAESPPGYLRAAAFDTFQGRDWQSSEQGRPLSPMPPAQRPAGTAPQGNAFALKAGADAGGEAWTVWPSESLKGAAFLPAGAAWLAAPARQVSENAHGIVTGLPSGTPYQVGPGRGSPHEKPAPELLEKCLAPPPGLNPAISALAAEIFAGAGTAREKTAAVENYFIGRHKYSLDIEIPRGRNPLEYFLLERPPAHCEYFASGAAVLLRLAGVPARYVTGFVADNQNPLTGCWTALNTDAHAWAEAWDNEAGRWVTVEATPPDGMPGAERQGWMRALMDWAAFTWAKCAALLRSPDWRMIPRLAAWLAGSPAAWLAAAVALLALLRRRLARRGPRRRKRTETAEVRALQALMKRMDRKMRRRGFARAAHETPHRFALRLEASEKPGLASAAAWYRAYAMARYTGDTAPDTAARLRAALHKALKPGA